MGCNDVSVLVEFCLCRSNIINYLEMQYILKQCHKKHIMTIMYFYIYWHIWDVYIHIYIYFFSIWFKLCDITLLKCSVQTWAVMSLMHDQNVCIYCLFCLTTYNIKCPAFWFVSFDHPSLHHAQKKTAAESPSAMSSAGAFDTFFEPLYKNSTFYCSTWGL